MKRKPEFRVFRDAGGEWRWSLVASNRRIVADSGEAYKTRAGAVRAASMVRDTVILDDPQIVVMQAPVVGG